MPAIRSPTLPVLGLTVDNSPHDFQKKSCGGLQTKGLGSKLAQAEVALSCAWGLATLKIGKKIIPVGLPHFYHHHPNQGCSFLSPAVVTEDPWSKTEAGRGEA